MANEFRHGSVGTDLSQAEWESITGHSFDAQATGDMMYASSATQLSRLAIGPANSVLTSTGSGPQWSATLPHESGGIEADISAITTGGILRGTGAGTMGILASFLTAGDLVRHEVGGIEADISSIASGGILRGTGTGTMGVLASFLTAGGLVRHEFGGIEANISAITTGGILRGTGAGAIGILAMGGALQVLRVNSGATGLEWAAANVDGQATQAAIEAETNENTYIPPDLARHIPGVAKAYCTVAADGTLQSNSYNITSSAKDATGNYTITIADDFANANYAVHVTPETAGTANRMGQVNAISGVGSFTVKIDSDTGSDQDCAFHVTCHGDQ